MNAPGPFAGLQKLGPVLEWFGRLVATRGASQVVAIERSRR